MADLITIASDGLVASINPFGAELSSLRDARGHEYMTDADPAFWTGRAPLLFPIVGRLNGDKLRVDGVSYAMSSHGFARRLPFALVRHDANRATFRLTDTPETRTRYPFAFELDADFALDAMTLSMTVTIRNPGDGPLLGSFGYHPAFAWPLPGGDRDRHFIAFDQDEPGEIARIAPDGTIANALRPTPVEGRRFVPDDAHFGDDALVWATLNSRRLTYGADGGAALDIAFPDTPSLGIWTKPGARFLCIEPWAGHADPAGFSGEFSEKPGIFTVNPDGSADFRMIVTVRP